VSSPDGDLDGPTLLLFLTEDVAIATGAESNHQSKFARGVLSAFAHRVVRVFTQRRQQER